MGPISLLAFLKYAGFAVSALSSVWGVFAKTSFEDESGSKRLTAAGHFAIAITIGSALIGMLAYGFESAEIQRQDDLTLRRNELAAQRAEQQRLDSERSAQVRSYQELVGQQKVIASQVVALATANKQLSLADKTSRDLERGTSITLSRIDESLQQLRRLAQPIGSVEIEVTWRIGIKNRSADAYVRRIRSAIESYEGGNSSALDGLRYASSLDGRIASVNYDLDSPLGPNQAMEVAWYKLANTGYRFMLFANRPLDAQIGKQPVIVIGSSDPSIPGDLSFSTYPTKKTIDFDLQQNEIKITGRVKVDPDLVYKNGKIVSILDLEKATIVLVPVLYWGSEFADPLVSRRMKQISLFSVVLLIGGVRYSLLGVDFNKVRDEYGNPMFRLDNLGRY